MSAVLSTPNFLKETPTDTDESAAEQIPFFQVVQLVLRLPIYYVISLSWLILCYVLDIFTATLFDYAVDKRTAEYSAVSLLSYSSLADLLGRILLPLLADHNYLNRSTLTACNCFMMCAAVSCLSLVTSYGALVEVTVAVSCSLGCGVSMSGVLLADYVGLDKLEVSYGLMGLLCGSLLFVKPFFVGFFRDKLGTYDDMYRIFAGHLFFLGVMWCWIVFSEKRSSRRYVL
ncbi:unnamed protein product, partial [Ixodes hexagonus]